MAARISAGMVNEYARYLAQTKDDAEQARKVFADGARIAAEGALVAQDEAEQTRRLKETLGLVDSGLGIADAATKDGSQGLQAASAVTGAAETGLGMVQEGWQQTSGKMRGLSQEAMTLSVEASRRRARLSQELSSLGSSATEVQSE